MKNFNLFEDSNDMKQAPLASRMRPLKLDEIVGQQHIIGKDKLLYRAIKADRLESIILYGPPGTGKTTIAKVIANTTDSYFCKLNATNAGIKDVEKELGISYPTVRAKLDEVILALGYDVIKEAQNKNEKLDILEALEKGEISADEALKKLKE